MSIPLASKIRPGNLKEFVGQNHLVGKGNPSTKLPQKDSEQVGAGPIRKAIIQKHLFSFILWGPPGCGKTTLAKIYAKSLNTEMFELSAVSAGKEDIRKIIRLKAKSPKVLFLDEIHRFNKAQQDFLLPFVESGELTLIGATTENPSFEVIAPLLSRCRVFVLESLNEKEMAEIIDRTKIKISKDAKEWLIRMADGDARQAIAVLENTEKLYPKSTKGAGASDKITLEDLKNTVQSKQLRYDKAGDEHYNTISAFIKSMRASQPDAALYYLARMIDAGEDPKFIARRMVIFASEDIGMAQPTALVVANEVFRAVETIGLPEAQINLAHGVVYLSTAQKDRRSYDAYFRALEDVKKYGNLPVPLKIRNTPTELMKNLGYGKNYKKYPTTDEKESYFPDKLKNKKYLEK